MRWNKTKGQSSLSKTKVTHTFLLLLIIFNHFTASFITSNKKYLLLLFLRLHCQYCLVSLGHFLTHHSQLLSLCEFLSSQSMQPNRVLAPGSSVPKKMNLLNVGHSISVIWRETGGASMKTHCNLLPYLFEKHSQGGIFSLFASVRDETEHSILCLISLPLWCIHFSFT